MSNENLLSISIGPISIPDRVNQIYFLSIFISDYLTKIKFTHIHFIGYDTDRINDQKNVIDSLHGTNIFKKPSEKRFKIRFSKNLLGLDFWSDGLACAILNAANY
jgi:hypothetical protein